jgi:hypothetical protein
VQELIQTPRNEVQASALVQLTLARMTEGADRPLQAALLEGFDQVLADISASAASPIERLLAQETAICWAEHQKLRATHSRLEQSLRPTHAVWWIHAISAAQLRFFRAVEELARVRRLTSSVDKG